MEPEIGAVGRTIIVSETGDAVSPPAPEAVPVAGATSVTVVAVVDGSGNQVTSFGGTAASPSAWVSTFLADTGNIDAESATSGSNFEAGPAAGKVWHLSCLRILVAINGPSPYTFGTAALSNGFTLQTRNGGGTILDITAAAPILDLSELAQLAGQTIHESVDDWAYAFELDFAKMYGTVPQLVGDTSDIIQWAVQDNLAGAGIQRLRFLLTATEYNA